MFGEITDGEVALSAATEVGCGIIFSSFSTAISPDWQKEKKVVRKNKWAFLSFHILLSLLEGLVEGEASYQYLDPFPHEQFGVGVHLTSRF